MKEGGEIERRIRYFKGTDEVSAVNSGFGSFPRLTMTDVIT